MLMVPRSEEFYQGVSLTSLAFAGAFLVRDEEQMQALEKNGLFKALQQTTGSRPPLSTS